MKIKKYVKKWFRNLTNIKKFDIMHPGDEDVF